MDTITHAIIGATLARATTPRLSTTTSLSLRSRTWLGGLAAAFPDIDYISYPLDPLSFITDWHRAETHSLIVMPLWALLLAFLLATIFKYKQQWREIALICGLSILSHILCDVITSWGTQIFAPLSTYRASLGTTFVIDPYFTLIILSGLILSMLRNSKKSAQIAITILILYVGMQGLLKLQVYNIAQEQAARFQWQQAHIYTMPQPFSPFNWKIIISEGDHYHMAYINLLADENKPPPNMETESLLNTMNYYRPKSKLSWSYYSRYGDSETKEVIRSAWQRPEFERYRRFSAFPAFSHQLKNAELNCAVFMDLRFSIPLRQPSFNYAICNDLNDTNNWKVLRGNLVEF